MLCKTISYPKVGAGRSKTRGIGCRWASGCHAVWVRVTSMRLHAGGRALAGGASACTKRERGGERHAQKHN